MEKHTHTHTKVCVCFFHLVLVKTLQETTVTLYPLR